jgi:Cytochrome C biogenesis protein transmembrane region
MLGSLNPFVQRVHNGRWSVTITSYVVSSIVAGTLIGGALGTVGQEVRSSFGQPSWHVAAALLASLGVVGAVIDLGPYRLRLPTIVRQVDEAWRYRYRNWVYAAGYGFQLGLGLVTIVTTTAVYTTLIATFLIGSWQLGALLGAWFGLSRSLSVLSVARIQTSAQFDAIDGGLKRWNRPSKIATTVGQVVLGFGLLMVLVV